MDVFQSAVTRSFDEGVQAGEGRAITIEGGDRQADRQGYESPTYFMACRQAASVLSA